MVEAGELDGPGTKWFLRQSLKPVLDSGRRPQRILLGCTHYPLLLPAIRRLVPTEVEILAQGEVVASRLGAWLERHPEQEARLGRSGLRRFVTTDDAAWFSARGEKLLGRPLTAERIRLRQSRWS